MAAKKAAPKAAAAAKPEAKTAKVRPMTKNELYSTLSEKTGVAKKDVASLFENLDELVRTSLTKRGGPKQFVLPGLLKIRLAEKKATPAKKGRNPQTGEIINIPAKPKRNTVKVTPLKALKDSVLTGSK
ncbi:HU family DNA-binding protein [Tautonia plasticadhaerens]|uniref:Viral histone-like protein n=1 Tax=Tautonia plasticadhaerens TaxID=2527974 RepID=A0A518H519_9BACT|nr:HU family DNA-binding protein [Tautonia plasticadhaerens]QDV35917.1 DNA-binding protein HRL53 [Tautonia plasticadhaerens]